MNNTTLEIGKLLPIIAPLLVVQLLLVITAVVALTKAEHTRGPKWMWVLIILFVNLIGPVAFFIFGRRNP
ncbi:PLD nuclease N-terminal domain-containing protein [Paenibacillus sp. NPDC058071]|uniref:PLD nuclease N-terminal domain-containing protein n=1 Tax=Paenibacillus sp. NPDC058071 TaxID=3346326 RepID=UPI0036D8E94C